MASWNMRSVEPTPKGEEAQHQSPPPPPAPPDLAGELIDWDKVRDWTVFIARAPLRQPRLGAGLLGGCFALAVASLVLLPKSYHCEAKLLAERNLIMPALGNPQRAIPREADSPTRAAADNILRHDNLVGLVRQTNLIEQWHATRAPLMRVKDGISRLVFGKPDEEDLVDGFVGLLEKRLKVTSNEGNSTVTIAIDWPDNQMAYRVVEAALQNFLEARHAEEVSAIAEAITILEGHAATARQKVEVALDQLKRAREGRPIRTVGPVAAHRVPIAAPVPGEPGEVAQLRTLIVAKRRAIADLEEYRHRRLAELQTQLTEQKGTYAAAHPVILTTRQSIEQLSKESPQIAALRAEERELVSEFVRRTGRDPNAEATRSAPAQTPLSSRANEIARVAPAEAGDDGLDFFRQQIRVSNSKYEDLLDRIEAARIELDTARAAFKFRYSMVRPAQVPKKPRKPVVPVTLGGGLVAGLLLAFLVPSMRDLSRGRIVEPWQLERQLDLPVLLVTPPPR